jgi:hypothetical protein
MAKGVGGRYGRVYLLVKAMNALSKRGMHKPPLTSLHEKQRQVLSLLVHGLDHADANRPDVPVGRPLSAPEIAETLGCRRSYVRDLLSDPLFKTEMAKAVVDARAALQPKALATLSVKPGLGWRRQIRRCQCADQRRTHNHGRRRQSLQRKSPGQQSGQYRHPPWLCSRSRRHVWSPP